MPATLKLAMVGLDTSHVEAFAKLLHDTSHPYHVRGARVVAAYPGIPSQDFALSRDRVDGYTRKLRDEFGVTIVGSEEDAAVAADAVLLESVDGRVHRTQLEKLAPAGKPVFVDKPFALSMSDAEAMFELAARHRFPLMSSSALRYAQGLIDALADGSKGPVIGADFYGPMAIEPTQPGFFWYGIHTAEALVATLGSEVRGFAVASNDDHDVLTAEWADGRIGTIRGNRKGNTGFGGVIHREKGSTFIDVYAHPKPYYAGLLENIIAMVKTGVSPVPVAETLAIIRMLEEANRLRESKAPARL
ncbi:MAG: gfo/Idh/MocA family oxidoreductase [Chthoniobacterales bacterium]|nr:gfo/Idh/MocA family oxidoreductase [Chthoniobacterales bacterium]